MFRDERPASKSNRVLAALLRIGWTMKRHAGTSHRVLERAGWPDYVFAFHDGDEIGPKMLTLAHRRGDPMIWVK
ncbi:MAG TPA: type II toxin-antitoxin system HicA family toxin [Thermoanaerobaculia bacterium]